MAIQNIVKKLVTWKKFIAGRKAIFLVFLVLFAVGLFFVVEPTLAQSGTTATTPTQSSSFVGDIWSSILQGISFLLMKLAQWCLSLVMFVLAFIIEVASYNGYLTSTAVSTGWVMVRDLTNMVFVIALLAIAFGTILGIENYEWKHMLFKLVSAAILVNFSRIICGIIIDISQVVMVTFLNGIAATLGGNFIRAFNLEKIQSFSATVNGGQIEPYSVFLTAAASLFVSVTILVVMAIMLAMLVARMIVLWVLVVLSPIAFVLGVLRKTEAYASEWWSEFGKNVVTGPVLIFFIWLTLVTVGNGVVNQEIWQNANGAPKPTDTSIAQVLTGDNLVNFAIAIGFLLVGINVTRRLGGIGSDWAGKAVDYGKKATYYATGAFAVRAAAQKGAEMAKSGARAGASYGLRKMPVVGGEAWARYGANAKNLARVGLATMEESKNRKVSDLMKAAYDKDATTGQRVKNMIKFKALDAITGSTMAKKIAEKREDRATKKEEIASRVLSSSSHPEAKKALETEWRLASVNETGKKIGAEKDAKEQARIAEAYSILGSSNFKNDEEREAELSKKLGYSEGQIKDLKNDFIRRKKAVEASASTETLSQYTQNVEKQAYTEGRAKLDQEITEVQGKAFKKGEVSDEANQVLTEQEFANMMERRGVSEDRRAEMLAKFSKGEKVSVPIKLSLQVDDTAESLRKAKEEIKFKLESGDIDSGEAKRLNENVDFRYREANAARLAKQANMAGRETSTARNLREAKAEEKLYEEPGREGEAFRSRDQRVTAATAESNQIQEKLTANSQLGLLQQIRDLLARDRERGAASRQGQIMASKAEIEQVEFERNNQRELNLAKARDEYLRGEGRSGEAVNYQKTLDRQAKMRVEMQSVGDYVLSTARTSSQVERVQDLRKNRAQIIESGKQEDSREVKDVDEAIRLAEKNLAEMMVANLGRHAAFYGGNAGVVLEAMRKKKEQEGGEAVPAELSMELNSESLRARQAELLSSLVNEEVEASNDGLIEGMKKLKYLVGGENATDEQLNAFLEQVRQQADVAAGQGSIGLAGLLKTRIKKDEKTGQTSQVTEFTNVDTEEGRNYVAGRRVSGLSGARLLTLSGGISGSVDRANVEVAGGKKEAKTVVSTDAAREMVVRIVSPVTNQQLERVDEYTKRDMSDILRYSDKGQLNLLIKDLFERAVDPKALKKLLEQSMQNFKDADSARASEVGEIISNYENISKKTQDKQGKKEDKKPEENKEEDEADK
jgi:hypothetical protein